jgi:ADP-heptose:LPS heptosyltransferase
MLQQDDGFIMIPSNVKDVRRLLIFRPDHLGDLILFSGALKHIRKHWPNSHIAMCVRKYGVELLKYCPHVDELIPYEKLNSDFWGQGQLDWMPRFRGSFRLGNIIRKHFPALARKKDGTDIAALPQSDIVILPVLAPTPENHQYMRQIPGIGKISICGNHTNQTPEFDRITSKQYSSQMDASQLPWDFKEVQVTKLFLKFIGIDVSDDELWPELWTGSEDKKIASELMAGSPGKIILGIAPGVTSVMGKNLPPQWFADVINLLNSKDLQVVLFGSAADQAVCDGVEKAIRGSCKIFSLSNLAGKTKVREMIECIRACDLVLAQETAALHAATAIRKPVVGIVGGGHYGRFYPWGDPELSRPVNKPMDCYGCDWICKFDTIRCIQEIPPADAAAQLKELLSRITQTNTTSSATN